MIYVIRNASGKEWMAFEFSHEDDIYIYAVPGSVVKFTDDLVCSEKECRFHKSVWIIVTCDVESDGFGIIIEKYNRMNLV